MFYARNNIALHQCDVELKTKKNKQTNKLLLQFVDDTHDVQRGKSRFHFCAVCVQPLITKTKSEQFKPRISRN